MPPHALLEGARGPEPKGFAPFVVVATAPLEHTRERAPRFTSRRRGRLVAPRSRPLRLALSLSVLAVLALATAAVVVALMQKASAEESAAVSAVSGYDAPSLNTTPSASPLITAVGATDLLARSGEAGTSPEWPARMAQDLAVRSTSYPVGDESLAALTVAGAVRLASQLPQDPAAVIIALGPTDHSIAGVERLLDSVRERAPKAQLVLVGPLLASERSNDVRTRGALQAIARSADARWIDPIRAGWFLNSGVTEATESQRAEQLTSTTAARLADVMRRSLRLPTPTPTPT